MFAPQPDQGMRDTGRLIRPRSIAAIGGSAAAEVIRQCRRMGYRGDIYPVHPHRDEIEGLACVRSVAELPSAPDAAFVGVNRHTTIQIVRELSAIGAGGAVCFASGFRESGVEGEALQAALLDAAGAMPILGPNTYGLVNYLDGALLWPDQHGGQRRERGVALLTQSSNIAINLTMNRRAVPIAYVITLGNQAQTGMSEMIRAVAADSRVSAIGLLIEGFDDIHAFVDAIEVARAAGTPVVVLKAGLSQTGAELAMSHTASLGGSASRVSALLRRLGVGQVFSLNTFLETLKLLHTVGPLPDASMVSLSCSGGEAILMADAGHRHGVQFPAFSPAHFSRIKATVSDLVQVTNPFDYHMFMWGDRAAMRQTFSIVMEGEQAVTGLVLDLPRDDRCDDRLWRPSMEALIDARQDTGRPAALIASQPEGLSEKDAEDCLAAGVAPLIGMDEAMIAIRTAADMGHATAARTHDAWRPLALVARRGLLRTETEVAAKGMLRAAGVTVPRGQQIHHSEGAEAAVRAAGAIGFPVVLKAVGEQLAHKTENNAVELGLQDEEAVRTAAERLFRISPDILVESMITDGVAEILVGYEADPVLGGFLTIAAGGTQVELFDDRVTLPLPTSMAEIAAALHSLRIGAVIRGFRGREPGDAEALIALVMGLAEFCCQHAATLHELDVNPVIVRPIGLGAVAVDALLRTRLQPAVEEITDE